MKILIVSGSFFPNNSPRAFRTTELAKEFALSGHCVTVYSALDNTYDFNTFSKKFNITVNNIDGVNRKTKKRRYISELLRIFVEYPDIQFYLKLKNVLKNENNYDLLISIAVPHTIHWGISRIYKKRKIARTWIADCGDPYMCCTLEKLPHPFYFKYLEKAWCNRCDYISVPADTSYKGYYPEFKHKIKVIPQGFNLDDVQLPLYIKNDIISFAYAGSFIKGRRDLGQLLDFLCDLKINFRFIIFAKCEDSLISKYKKILGNKVEFNGIIPRQKLLILLSKMEFLINLGNGTNIQIPSKLIDYTIAGRPILTIEYNNLWQNTLREFLVGNYDHKDKDIDLSKYNIRRVANQFLELCSK